MEDRRDTINFVVKAIIEVLKVFELQIAAKQKGNVVFPIIIDCRDGKEYFMVQETVQDGSR